MQLVSVAVQWICQQVTLQATLLSYVDVFWVMSLAALAAMPLAFGQRK
jgi:hypothetical protein